MIGQSNSSTVSSYIKIENEDITVTQNGIYEASEGYTGLGTVTVNVSGGGQINNQDKTVNASTSQQRITADQGYTGLGTVTINAVKNVLPENIKSGKTILGVTGNVVELNGETIHVTPSTSSQTILPSGQHNGITEVRVSAVTSNIDSNITAENIVKDVTILGVTGSYEGVATNNQDKNITEDGTYTFDTGYTGLGTVIVTAGAGVAADMEAQLHQINSGSSTTL